MKKTLIFSIFILVFIGCSNSNNIETTKKEENLLIGTWKLIESKNSDGGATPTDWTVLTDAYDMSLNQNNTFTSTQYTNCSNGTYTKINEKVILTFSCSTVSSPKEFIISSNNINELILRDLSCFEECSLKFKKLNN